MHPTVKGRIILAMSALVLVDALSAGLSWYFYSRAADRSVAAQRAEHKVAAATMASDRITSFSADANSLALTALQSSTSEELSNVYGNVLGSESAGSSAVNGLKALCDPATAKSVGAQWDDVRLGTYLFVNAEASAGGLPLRIRTDAGGRYRASVASNLETPTALVGADSSKLRANMRARTEGLRDATLRQLMAEATAENAVALKDAADARALASDVTVSLLVASLLLAIAASAWLYRSIARPLQAARAYADQVAGGDWNARITEHRDDEIGALTRAIENMKDSVVQKVTIMREMAGAVLVIADEVKGSAEHASSLASQSALPGADGLSDDLGTVARDAETLASLAAQMLEV